MKSNSMVYTGWAFLVILLVIGTSIGSNLGICDYPDKSENGLRVLPRSDSTPPMITINFAGNLSDSGGPYYRPPGEHDTLDEEGEGIWRDGYYTNDSFQQETWIYLNLTVNDTQSAVQEVRLHWWNVTTNTWYNTSYLFLNTAGNCYEFDSRGNITITPGQTYSFNILALDTAGNVNLSAWNKTGIGGKYTRRYVTLGCSPETILYRPFYLVTNTSYTGTYGEDEINKMDRLHHDQASDGTTHDGGYLNSSIPDDSVSFRWCNEFVVYWFEDNVCIEPFSLDNIYYHFWWSTDSDEMQYTGWMKTRRMWYKQVRNGYHTDSTFARSSLYYDNHEPVVSNQYFLDTHLLEVSPLDFVDNDIYELVVKMVEDPPIPGGGDGHPSVITNRSFLSFIILNVPDDTTLNATHPDTDDDHLSDWTELYRTFTSPFLADTDNDGVNDFNEHRSGSDPNNYTDTEEPATLLLEGYCYDTGMQPVDDIHVEVINLNTSRKWQATTEHNQFSLFLIPGEDINETEILRVIACNTTHMINVTDYFITEEDIDGKLIQFNALILDIHYFNIWDFPMVGVEFIPDIGFRSGAATGEMFLEYLTQEEYDQSWIYANFTGYVPTGYWEDWYDDPDYISAHDLMWGIGTIAQEYGYGFMAYANDTSPYPILRSICSLIDFEIDYADPGHPTHCPAAIPAFSNYSNWLVIRGIHTDQVTYPPPTSFDIYGFWINDPKIEGIGENTYKTVTELLTTYFHPMNLSGEPYENNSYVCVVEPPEGFATFDQIHDYSTMELIEPPGEFSQRDTLLIDYVQKMGGKAPLLQSLAKNTIHKAARQAANRILRFESELGEAFIQCSVEKSVYVASSDGDYYIVVFADEHGLEIVVLIDAAIGALREFSSAQNADYTKELTDGEVYIHHKGQSLYHPTIVQ